MISFLGNFYRHLVICFWSRCLEDKWLSICLGWELSNQILLVCIVLRSVWPDYAILKGLGDRFSYKSSSNILSYFEKSAGQLLSKICLLFIPTSGHTSYNITIFKSSCAFTLNRKHMVKILIFNFDRSIRRKSTIRRSQLSCRTSRLEFGWPTGENSRSFRARPWTLTVDGDAWSGEEHVVIIIYWSSEWLWQCDRSCPKKWRPLFDSCCRTEVRLVVLRAIWIMVYVVHVTVLRGFLHL